MKPAEDIRQFTCCYCGGWFWPEQNAQWIEARNNSKILVAPVHTHHVAKLKAMYGPGYIDVLANILWAEYSDGVFAGYELTSKGRTYNDECIATSCSEIVH